MFKMFSKFNNKGLHNKVCIYVPSTVNVDQKVDNKKYIDFVNKELCLLFGGATMNNVIGSWFSDDLQKVVTEDITIIYSNCTDKQLQSNLHKVVKLCKKLCKDMEQECISLEVNNVLYFIDEKF